MNHCSLLPCGSSLQFALLSSPPACCGTHLQALLSFVWLIWPCLSFRLFGCVRSEVALPVWFSEEIQGFVKWALPQWELYVDSDKWDYKEKAFLISFSPSSVNSAACGKQMSGLPVKGPRMAVLDFIEVFACIALYSFLGKILLVGHCNSLSTFLNVNKFFLAFPFQQLFWWLNTSIEFLVYRQEIDLVCILLVTTTQLFGCFLFQPPLMISARKGHVNDRYFETRALLVEEKLMCGREVVLLITGAHQCVEAHIPSEKGYIRRLCH